jgi:hypothetical protein
MNCPIIFDKPAGILEFVDSNAVSDEASCVSNMFHETREKLWSSFSLGYSREECQRRVLDAWSDAMSVDWDGYDARIPEQQSIFNAWEFIDVLPSDVSTPEVSVDPDGEISFDWFAAPRRQFSISIGTKGVLSYAGLFGSDKVSGSERFRGPLPRTLLDHIKRVV